MQLLNFGLLKHPLNWLTIVVMLILAAMAGTLVLEGVGLAPSTADGNSGAVSDPTKGSGGPGNVAN